MRIHSGVVISLGLGGWLAATGRHYETGTENQLIISGSVIKFTSDVTSEGSYKTRFISESHLLTRTPKFRQRGVAGAGEDLELLENKRFPSANREDRFSSEVNKVPPRHYGRAVPCWATVALPAALMLELYDFSVVPVPS
ncbi:hypothetical protein EVAR_32689_1 [Eumeta japonica]|uniref:Uncharacterized protein n=1 Tax=Eumeta variegata TaxID=151549 RepID=A0A4C1VNF1_EUMVA|nr:hypothetical protein EVAR_32689_1 [Eumeta japonica]